MLAHKLMAKYWKFLQGARYAVHESCSEHYI